MEAVVEAICSFRSGHWSPAPLFFFFLGALGLFRNSLSGPEIIPHYRSNGNLPDTVKQNAFLETLKDNLMMIDHVS